MLKMVGTERRNVFFEIPVKGCTLTSVTEMQPTALFLSSPKREIGFGRQKFLAP